jgi:tetratricopeptide (TPR) repeat protein
VTGLCVRPAGTGRLMCARCAWAAGATGPSTSSFWRRALINRWLFGAFAGCALAGAHSEDLRGLTAPNAVVTFSSPSKCSESSDAVALFKRGTSLVSPYMLLSERPRSVAQQHIDDVREGIACLDKAIQLRPDYWQALWFRGKAYQALGETQSAAESFRAAYNINPNNPDVGRELVLTYLDQSAFGEALPIAKRLADTQPNNAGLRANFALVLILDGQIGAAQVAIADALRLDPSDSVTQALKTRIDEVASGKRAMPKSVRDLER